MISTQAPIKTPGKIALILPAYNEAMTIRQVIFDFYHQLPTLHIVVVDNRSTDETAAVAQRTFDELGCAGVVLFEPRPGKGNAIRLAFQKIFADVYVMADADSTYFSSDLPRLLQPILEGRADMVVGDRHSAGDYGKHNTRRFHEVGNLFVKSLINGLFGAKLQDILSGYRTFSRYFVKNFAIASEGFELETELTLHALDKRFRVAEVSVKYQERPEGSHSKLNTVRDGFKVIRTTFDVFRYYRPFTFFSTLAALCLLGGVGIGIPVLLEFLETGYIAKVPSAILSSGIVVISFLLFSVALILENVVKNHRELYFLWLLKNDV